VGKLGDTRRLTVNLLRFFRGHLGLEGQSGRGFLQARNRPDPSGARWRRNARVWQASRGAR
jgi:hypothetical protein